MSFVGWLKRAFVPLKRVDPRFGPMRFMRMRPPHGPSYWEGSGTFAGEQVEFLVDADDLGPSAAQRARCDELERRWSTIEPMLTRFLATRGNAVELRASSSRSLADWSLGMVALPAAADARSVVEFTFVERDGGELLVFELVGGEPRGARVGG